MDRMTDFTECGSTGMTVLGVMGEAPKLEGGEAEAWLPLCEAGSQSRWWWASRRRASRPCGRWRRFHGCRRAGVMIAPPNTLRTDDQITGYFRQAVEAIGDDIPCVVQDFR